MDVLQHGFTVATSARVLLADEPTENVELKTMVEEEARISIVIADDHPLILVGLQSMLAEEDDLFLVGGATKGGDAQQICCECQPDVLLLDSHMPGPSALEIVACLRQHCPQTRILMLASRDVEGDIRSLVNVGAAGYLFKEESSQAVVRAIRAVMQGGAWFSQRAADKLAQPTDFASLTQREQDVLRCIAAGKTDRQIGLELGVSERTVRYSLKRICEKLGVTTRVEAAVQVTKRGLI